MFGKSFLGTIPRECIIIIKIEKSRCARNARSAKKKKVLFEKSESVSANSQRRPFGVKFFIPTDVFSLVPYILIYFSSYFQMFYAFSLQNLIKNSTYLRLGYQIRFPDQKSSELNDPESMKDRSYIFRPQMSWEPIQGSLESPS